MGRNAKLCKRIKKNTASHHSLGPAPPSSNTQAIASTSNAHRLIQAARKRTDLKSRSKSRSSSSKATGEHILGGADYVTLLMGGRKKAAEEASKLLQD